MDTELHQLVLQLTERVNRLEKMVRSNPIADTPSTNLSEWIGNCMVTVEDVDMVYENNGFMNAFKNCITRNHSISPIPIMKLKNTMYVYEYDGWEKLDSTTHIHVLTRDIWRKFLRLHMQTPVDPLLEDDMRDMQRKCILEMRQKLYEVKKNRMELCRWVMKIDS
jgi:hypothetical protein